MTWENLTNKNTILKNFLGISVIKTRSRESARKLTHAQSFCRCSRSYSLAVVKDVVLFIESEIILHDEFDECFYIFTVAYNVLDTAL